MKIETNLDNLTKEVGELKNCHEKTMTGIEKINDKIDNFHEKLDLALKKKADLSEFLYWRNLLVSGIIVTIFVTVIINLLVGDN